MSKRSPPDGPCRTKATYDHKRPRFDPPSPAQLKAELEEKMRDAAKSKQFAQLITKVGLAQALFPEKFPLREPIKRRI